MIILRQVCFSANTFLGKTIETDLGKPGFNINQLKVKEDDFIRAILNFEKSRKNYSVIKPLSFQMVKKRVELETVYWDFDNSLNVVWGDRESEFFWSFVFTSPTDKVEVDQVGD